MNWKWGWDVAKKGSSVGVIVMMLPFEDHYRVIDVRIYRIVQQHMEIMQSMSEFFWKYSRTEKE